MSVSTDIAHILARDLRAFARDIEGMSEAELWRTLPGVNNPVGSLAWHVCGNLRHFIGALLGGDGYVRQLATEFSARPSKSALLAELELTAQVVEKVLTALPAAQLAAEMPSPPPHHQGRSVQYFLVQLVAHFQRHQGQADYLRRQLQA
jgi:uncharacterized damage-inducible protein DinB